MDYNGYRRNASDRFLKWTDARRNTGRYQSLQELFQATGLEQHGIEVDYDIFVRAGPPAEGTTYAPADYDLRLAASAQCIDKGTIIPQVTDGYRGSAPDLGCYEWGNERPHYGPRP